MTDRIPLIICGRTIGTCDGWDEADTLVMVYYDFESVSNITIPATSCLCVNFAKGEISVEDDAAKVDLIDLLSTIPRDHPL